MPLRPPAPFFPEAARCRRQRCRPLLPKTGAGLRGSWRVLTERRSHRRTATRRSLKFAGQIFAYRLVQDYGINIKQTIQFHDADIEDGILVLDLRTARISARSAAHYRRHRTRTEESKYPGNSGSDSGSPKVTN